MWKLFLSPGKKKIKSRRVFSQDVNQLWSKKVLIHLTSLAIHNKHLPWSFLHVFAKDFQLLHLLYTLDLGKNHMHPCDKDFIPLMPLDLSEEVFHVWTISQSFYFANTVILTQYKDVQFLHTLFISIQPSRMLSKLTHDFPSFPP